MRTVRRIALALVIIGAINWGLIGFFQFDLIAAIFGGQGAAFSRVIFALVGLGGIYALTLLFEPTLDDDMYEVNDTSAINYGTEFGDELDLFDDEENDDL